MGFWANLLTHKKKRQQQFQDASGQIRSGVLKRLETRLGSDHDAKTVTSLARAVASELFSEPPDEEIRTYLKSNGKLVRTTIDELKDEPELRQILTAFFRVIDSIQKHDRRAFKDDFTRPPLEFLRETGLIMEDVPEPLIEDFFTMAETFSEKTDR